MIRTPLAALALTATLGLPAAAEMTETERAEFRAEVRSYLMENPEVLMEAIGVLEQRQAAQAATGDKQLIADNAAALFEDDDSWVGGNPEGDVTIVEFLDYRCGYCKRAHPEVAELLSRDGDIRIIIKEFPILGAESLTASRFAIATREIAGDAAYATVHDALMELRGEVNDASLTAIAEDAGLDADAILVAMSDPAIDEIINRNRALGQRMNINGTPSFVFGDQMVRGYVPLEAMEEIVAAQRAD